MLFARRNRKINILFIIMQMEMGGSERLVHSLVRNIDRNRFSPSVAWFFGQTPLPEFRELEVPLFHIQKSKRVDLNAMYKLSDFIKKHNVTVVNAHHFMSMVYASWGCIRNGAKLFYTEHSSWEIEKINRRWTIAGRQLLRKANGAIGVSENVSITLRKYFHLPYEKSYTIPNGIDLEVFSRKDDSQVRQELGLESNQISICMVANFKKVKNHIYLLRGFEALSRNNNNVRLLLIGKSVPDGEGDTEHEIRTFISSHGMERKVLMLGFQHNVARLLGAVDIFCLTSLKEGLPIGLIEAMAAGCAVIGTDVEGIRDVIIPEQNGLLVPLGETQVLVGSLERLAGDRKLRSKLGQAARNTAIQHFSIEACVKAHENLFEAAFSSGELVPVAVKGKSL